MVFNRTKRGVFVSSPSLPPSLPLSPSLSIKHIFIQPPTLNVLPLAVFLSLAAPPSSASGLARRSTCRKSAVRRRMRLWM